MDPFELPEELPADVAGLAEIREAAAKWFDTLKSIVDAGEDLTENQLDQLRTVAKDIETIDKAVEKAEEADESKRREVAELIDKVGKKDPTGEVDDEEKDEDNESETDESETNETADEAQKVIDEAEAATKDAADQSVAASGKRKTSFAGKGSKRAPVINKATGTTLDSSGNPIGWRMDENSFGYKPGVVGFAEIAGAIDSVRPGSRVRSNREDRGSFAARTIARLNRDVELVEDSHALVAAIEKATSQLANGEAVTAASLTAAGGWCAPSETLYDFCDVPDATDLLSLPEITIRRGGVRWPVEPDMSQIFEDFQFFFTEPQLEAVDAEGNPTAIKQCVEIPCPDEFEELRLNAVGYCVEAGILQTQGWPELIEWFMRSLTAEHLRAISRRSILDMVAGSGPAKIIPPTSQTAAASSVLNSLALMATNLRLNKGLARTATIEGVAPSWFFEVLRADLANQQGVETKAVTDQQITAWLTMRNIALQFVGDWQTRSASLPGNLDTLVYPGTVDILLYPAGTWFRSMSNVIELGVMYPKEQLQVNRYTRFFTEDAIAIGKRCNQSILVRVPIHPDGSFGAQRQITLPAYA